jgi:hypothetical protein
MLDPVIVCPDGCADTAAALPTLKFDDCAPEVNGGEIQRLYLGIVGHPFTDIEDPEEWADRLAGTTPATKIVRLNVSADKPKPTGTVKDISLGRKIVLSKDHTINATVDETTQENHDAFSKMSQCGGTYLLWYETAGGLVFGGNRGIKVSIDADMVIPRAKGDSITWELTVTWSDRATERRTVSPIA